MRKGYVKKMETNSKKEAKNLENRFHTGHTHGPQSILIEFKNKCHTEKLLFKTYKYRPKLIYVCIAILLPIKLLGA